MFRSILSPNSSICGGIGDAGDSFKFASVRRVKGGDFAVICARISGGMVVVARRLLTRFWELYERNLAVLGTYSSISISSIERNFILLRACNTLKQIHHHMAEKSTSLSSTRVNLATFESFG